MNATTGDDVVQAVTDVMQDTAGSNRFMADFFASDLWQLILRIIVIAIIVIAVYIVKKVVKHILKRVEQQLLNANNASGAALVGFGSHIASGLIYFAGVILVVSCIPMLESALSRLLAAGGVLAVIAGLASQQALGDMVSGLMILAFQPFRLGDVVRYVDNNISGVVDEITVHHTTIRTFENKRVIIPNSKMNSAIIENADYADSKVCAFFEIGITYESDIEQAKQILSAQIQQHPDFFDYRSEEEKAAGAPAVVVRVIELADSAVILRAWMWAKDNGTAAVMKSDLMQSVKLAYDAAGVDIAYPHLVVVNK